MNRKNLLGLPLMLLSFVIGACGGSSAKGPLDRSGVPAGTAAVEDPKADSPELGVPEGSIRLTLLGMNDVHGAWQEKTVSLQGKSVKVGGFHGMKAYLDAVRASNPNTLVFAAGDLFQGTPLSNMFLGQSLVPLYNKFGITAATMGNHDLDYGQEAFVKILQGLNFPFVLGNIRKKIAADELPFRETGKIEGTKIVEVSGIRVGIMGLTTMSTPSDTGPTNAAGLEFFDFYPSAMRDAQALRSQGAHVVVLVSHDGGSCDMSQPAEQGDAACIKTDPVSKLLTSLPKGTIDAVIAGHTHAPQAHLINGVPVVQNADAARSLSRIDIWVRATNADGTAQAKVEIVKAEPRKPIYLCHQVFEKYASCDAQEMANISSDVGSPIPAVYEGKKIVVDDTFLSDLSPYLAQIEPILNRVATNLPKALVNDRMKESYASNCFVDAEKLGFEQVFNRKVDLSYTNSGKIRANFPAGNLRYEDIYTVMPFEFKAVLVELTGAEINELASKFNVIPKDISVVSEGWQILLKPTFPKHAGLRKPDSTLLGDTERLSVLIPDQYLEVYPEIFERATREHKVFVADKTVRDVLFEGFVRAGNNLPKSCLADEPLQRNTPM